MKVFISHKREDLGLAEKIAKQLTILKVPCYLDELDHYIYDSDKDLTSHIKSKMHDCTDLLVLMTNKTKDSWWVPFEIGMAADRNYPTITYRNTWENLPDYLSFWPQITTLNELSIYKDNILLREERIDADNRERELFESLGMENFSQKQDFVLDFYRHLKSDLQNKQK